MNELEETSIRVYLEKSKQLGEILDKLGTREYCKEECPLEGNYGCCTLNFPLMGTGDTIISLQVSEATGNGWKRHEDQERCLYHNEDGCNLEATKSPVCIEYLCSQLRKSLIERFNESETIESFLSSMTRVKGIDEEDQETFLPLNNTIKYGQELLEE